jgi:hypothetical protein
VEYHLKVQTAIVGDPWLDIVFGLGLADEVI